MEFATDNLIARVLLTLVTLGYSLAPVLADFNKTHATNPLWTPHARFHVVWQVSSYCGIGLIALVLIWTAGPVTKLWLAVALAAAMYGGFFATADDHEALIARRKDLEDNPIPSGASAAAFGLLRLAALTGEHGYEEAALGVIRLLHGVAPEHPHAFGHLLQAMDFHFAAVKEVAIAGPGAAPLERVVRGAYRPHVVLAGGPTADVPLLAGRAPVDGRAAAYVCEHFACRQPVTEPDELDALL